MRRADLFPVGVLIALPWLWFNRALLPTLTGTTFLPFDNLYAFQPYRGLRPDIVPHNPLISDLVLQSVPWALHTRRALASGNLPLWNPDVLTGSSFLAADQPAVLYPPSLIVALLPVADGFGVFIAVHLALLAIGVYTFGRVVGWTPAAALVAALAFGYGGFSITSVTFPQAVASAAWTPLLLAIVERLVQGPLRVRLWAAGVVSVALQVLAGHIEIAVYGLLFVSLYTILRLGVIVWRTRSVGSALGRGAVIVALMVLGAGCGAAQVLPFKEALDASVRVGSQSPEAVLRLAWPVPQLWTTVLPDLYGNPTHHRWLDPSAAVFRASPDGAPIVWGTKNYVEGGQYLGVLTWVLAAIGVGRGSRGLAVSIGGLAVLSLALVLGAPLYRLILLLPGGDALRTPFRWAFPLSLAIALLAGLGADTLVRSRRAARLLPIGLGLAGGLLLVVLASGRLWPEPLVKLARRLITDPAWGERAFGDAAHNLGRVFASPEMFLGYQTPGVLRLALALIGSALVVGLVVRRTRLGMAAGLVLLAADLFSVHGGFFPQADNRLSPLVSRPPLVAALTTLAERTGAGQPWRFTTVERADEKTLLANVGMYEDWQDLRGYDSIISRQYAALTERLGLPRQALDFNRVAPVYNPAIVGSRLLDLLNVRFLVSEYPLASPTLREVYRDTTGSVYENATVLPRAFIAPAARVLPIEDQPLNNVEPLDLVYLDQNPDGELTEDGGRGTARVTAYAANAVSLEATVDGPAWLVVSDAFAPGWTASVWAAADSSSRDAEVLRAYGGLRAVHLPAAGSYAVHLEYRPRSLLIGGVVSLASVLVLVGTVVLVRLLRSKTTGPATDRSARRRPPHALYSPAGRGA